MICIHWTHLAFPILFFLKSPFPLLLLFLWRIHSYTFHFVSLCHIFRWIAWLSILSMNGLLQLVQLTRLWNYLIFGRLILRCTLLTVISTLQLSLPLFSSKFLPIFSLEENEHVSSTVYVCVINRMFVIIGLESEFDCVIREEVFQVGWSPKNETILASCCLGRRLMVWDLSRYTAVQLSEFFQCIPFCFLTSLLIWMMFVLTELIRSKHQRTRRTALLSSCSFMEATQAKSLTSPGTRVRTGCLLALLKITSFRYGRWRRTSTMMRMIFPAMSRQRLRETLNGRTPEWRQDNT